MDRVADIFDTWADDGRDRMLEKGHRYSVDIMLDCTRPTHFENPFSFLDVGCGNGWVVRQVASMKHCNRAVGIDSSPLMIRNALDLRRKPMESYETVLLEEFNAVPFDVVFSMESLYYSASVSKAISHVYRLVAPGGMFVCGVDYYTENSDTIHWGDMLGVTLQLHPVREWLEMLQNAGFEAGHRFIKDPASSVRWKREQGTLFLTAKKNKTTPHH